jgi:hypothetical protein
MTVASDHSAIASRHTTSANKYLQAGKLFDYFAVAVFGFKYLAGSDFESARIESQWSSYGPASRGAFIVARRLRDHTGTSARLSTLPYR